MDKDSCLPIKGHFGTTQEPSPYPSIHRRLQWKCPELIKLKSRLVGGLLDEKCTLIWMAPEMGDPLDVCMWGICKDLKGPFFKTTQCPL